MQGREGGQERKECGQWIFIQRSFEHPQGWMGIHEHAEASDTASDLKGSERTTLRAHMGLEILGVPTGQSGKTS